MYSKKELKLSLDNVVAISHPKERGEKIIVHLPVGKFYFSDLDEVTEFIDSIKNNWFMEIYEAMTECLSDIRRQIGKAKMVPDDIRIGEVWIGELTEAGQRQAGVSEKVMFTVALHGETWFAEDVYMVDNGERVGSGFSIPESIIPIERVK